VGSERRSAHDVLRTRDSEKWKLNLRRRANQFFMRCPGYLVQEPPCRISSKYRSSTAISKELMASCSALTSIYGRSAPLAAVPAVGDLPDPALGQDLRPSPTARRAQVQ